MRKLSDRMAIFIDVVLFSIALYNLYTQTLGVFDIYKHMCINLFLILPLIYIIYPLRKKNEKRICYYDYLFAALAVITTLILLANYWNWFFGRTWLASPITVEQLFVSISLIFLIVEAVRRTAGKALMMVILFFLGYVFLAPYLPYPLGFRTTFSRAVEYLTLTSYGIFSLPLQTMVTYVITFTILGAVYSVSGVGEFFMELSKALVGKSVGGAAKVAIIASSFFGTISGVAVANVYATGIFTIPTMIKLGYDPHFAAAVEATASTGGQIMPPVMGAAAFIMAELLRKPYVEIMTAAVIPALLYYTAVYCQVHFHSQRHGLVGLPKDIVPKLSDVLKKKSYCVIPLVVFVYCLISLRWNPVSSAISSFYVAVVLSFIKKDVRKNPLKIVYALIEGAKDSLSIVAIAAGAGLVVGAISYSGLGVKAGALIEIASFGFLPLALLYTALITTLLGMGMPTTAAYIMASTLSVPALSRIGLDIFVSHFFVFYYAVLSAITPPVALAAYAAASLAKTDPMKVGLQSVKLAIAGLIAPFAFVYKPELLLVTSGSLTIGFIWHIITSFIGVFAIASALEGVAKKPVSLMSKICLFAGGLLLLSSSDILTNAVGLLFLALTIVLNLRFLRNP
ncbi:MAG: TRAP transporter fused permease subunit [Sulfolobales archaeon]